MQGGNRFFILAEHDSLLGAAEGFKKAVELFGAPCRSNIGINQEGKHYFSRWDRGPFLSIVAFWTQTDHLVLLLKHGIDALPISVKALVVFGQSVGRTISVFHPNRGMFVTVSSFFFLDDPEVKEWLTRRFVKRKQYTADLTNLKMDVTGENGVFYNLDDQFVSYDQLDLPFSLIEQIETWACSYRETLGLNVSQRQSRIGALEEERQKLIEEIRRALPHVELSHSFTILTTH